MARLQNNFSPINIDRVAEAIIDYETDYAKSKIYSPYQTSREDIELKLGHYNNLYLAFRKNAFGKEKDSLKFLRYEIGRLRAQLNPNFFNRIYYSEFADFLRENFRPKDNPIHHFQIEILKIEKKTMLEHNVQALSASMKTLGFNIEMEGQLRKMLNQDFPQFHFRYSDPRNPDAHYVIHINKIPETGLYYFDRFEAIKLVSLDSVLTKDKTCNRQVFYTKDDITINASEAAKLVNGKSICKSIDGDETWLSLDHTRLQFQNPYQFHSFDLEKTLSQLPIQERNNPTKYQQIIQALKEGRKKEVTLMANETATKYFIEAAPQRKIIDIVDKDNRLVDIHRLLKGQQANIAKQIANKIQQQQNSVDIGEIKIKGMSI